jgi:hypothetical protein
MQAHGFILADMIELVRAGLAAAICGRVVEDRLKVTRVRLTEEGPGLILKRAPIGWNQDDFDVVEDG